MSLQSVDMMRCSRRAYGVDDEDHVVVELMVKLGQVECLKRQQLPSRRPLLVDDLIPRPNQERRMLVAPSWRIEDVLEVLPARERRGHLGSGELQEGVVDDKAKSNHCYGETA